MPVDPHLPDGTLGCQTRARSRLRRNVTPAIGRTPNFYGYAGDVSLPVQRSWTAWTKFTIGLPAADADAPGTSSLS